jgi:hypothetical protein
MEHIDDVRLRVWEDPAPTGQYVIGCDPAWGRNDWADRSSISVWRCFADKLIQVAEYADSDVDVVVRLNEIFFSDLSQLSPEDVAAHEAARTAASYTLAQFKAEVLAWLVQKYGEDVKPGKKAILIKGRGARRDADVLVCAKVRRYTRFKNSYDQKYVEGIRFFLSDGTHIDNFPTLHYENCIAKHQGTGGRFKPTVRIYKNLRNTMTEKGLIVDGLAPSYFLEGLLYNVERAQFGGTQQQNFCDTLNWLVKADRSKFVCANGIYYLCHPTSPVTWRAEKCSEFLSAAVNYWNG